jgi:hypothetical protein
VIAQKKISLEELRARLQGNGLVTEGEGVFRADHILIVGDGTAADVAGSFVVRAVSASDEDGSAVLRRLERQLADVANVAFQAVRNPLRPAS